MEVAVTVALMAVGAVAVFTGWVVVRAGRVSVWPVTGVVVGALAVASLATGRIVASGRVGVVAATGGGLAAGAGLYGATVAFVVVVRRWPAFDRHVAQLYDQRQGLSLPTALILAAGVVAPGEEVFWRGLFQGRSAEALGALAGGALTWGVYVLANAGSASLPILAAAVVSGGVWGALALWTHAVLAGLWCHALWTGLMVVWPPGGARAARRPGGCPGRVSYTHLTLATVLRV
jgi:membrane protease YdiL (CAAX protease family)